MAFVVKKDPISGRETRTYVSNSSSSKSSSSSSSSSSASRTSSGGSSYDRDSGGSRPSSGGSSYSSSTQYSGGGAVNRDYHQEAKDAAALGDWDAVTRALAARQAKIDAQGGNDRGTSNAQILQNLQNQYKSSYSALPSTTRDTLGMAASGQLNGRGWESGHDYLAEAQAYAKAGDMEAAYDALRRRGFKMADTGSQGGGTSQDQAYALIQGLYDHSQGAASSYQSQLAENQRRLQEHPTQFGTGTNPSLAGKHFVSQDGQYIIYYDSSGTPFKAQPNNGQYGSTKYTPEYRALMERYYSGSDDYADLRRQMHNLDVVYSGDGRLIDQNWNWASGEAAPVRDAYQYWTDFDNGVGMNRNTGQDRNALAAVLSRINQGQTFQTPSQAPREKRTGAASNNFEAYDGSSILTGTGGGAGSGGGLAPSGSGNGLVSGGSSGLGNYVGDDLREYIKQMYQQSLEAQLAGLQASYDQSRAAYQSQREQMEREYQAQRNQAAAQNDLQRMYMAELGVQQGLNTGATGQLALAQSMALQNQMSNINGLEGQELNKIALALSQLTRDYQSGVDAARAQNSSDLSGALYNESVRQIQAAEAARSAAQAQANWQAQFDYQKQQDLLAYELQKQAAAQAQANWQAQFDYQTLQDALAQQYQQQAAEAEYRQQLAQLEAAANKQNASNAWDYAQLLLKNGVVPDEATLYAAGLDAGSAQALADSYKWQLSQKYAPKTSSGKRSGGSSGGTGSKPRLTYPQVMSAIEDGITTPEVQAALDYYAGSGAYQQHYGDAGGAGNGGVSGNISTYIQGVNNALTNGNTMAANGYLRSIWPNLSEGEKQQMQSVLSRYGIRYTP